MRGLNVIVIDDDIETFRLSRIEVLRQCSLQGMKRNKERSRQRETGVSVEHREQQ